jgi:uncharacterized phage protein (TIGR02216 family)
MKRPNSRGFWRLMFALEKHVSAAAFWRRSPVELFARLDGNFGAPLTRQRLRDLQAAYPDDDCEGKNT